MAVQSAAGSVSLRPIISTTPVEILGGAAPASTKDINGQTASTPQSPADTRGLEHDANELQKHYPLGNGVVPQNDTTAASSKKQLDTINALKAHLDQMTADLTDLMAKHEKIVNENRQLQAELTPMMASFKKAFPHYDAFQGLFGKNTSPEMYSSLFGNNMTGGGANSMFSSKWTAAMFGLGAVSILGTFGLGAALIFGM